MLQRSLESSSGAKNRKAGIADFYYQLKKGRSLFDEHRINHITLTIQCYESILDRLKQIKNKQRDLARLIVSDLETEINNLKKGDNSFKKLQKNVRSKITKWADENEKGTKQDNDNSLITIALDAITQLSDVKPCIVKNVSNEFNQKFDEVVHSAPKYHWWILNK